MEVANWNGANIHRTSLKLGLRSEASGRFEKQLQPEQAMEAQAVATRLMIELCGARLVPGTIDVGGDGPPPKTIRLRDARSASLLGAPIPRERSAEILQRARVHDRGGRTTASTSTVPAFRRADVTREADLIEEVARLDGLEKLPATLPSRHGASGRLTPRQRLRRRAADALTAQGLHEIVGWSFAGPELADRLRLPEDERRTTRRAREPDVGRPVAAAHDAARLAARRRPPQPRPRRRHAPPVRGRRRVPADEDGTRRRLAAAPRRKVGGAWRRRLDSSRASPTTSARC